MKRIPTAAAAVSVPPTVVAPTAPLRRARREVARAELARVGRESLELVRRQPDDDPAVEHADRRRRRARGSDGRLAGTSHVEPVRRGEAVRDERRLERDDGPLLGQRGRDLVGDADQVLHAGDP